MLGAGQPGQEETQFGLMTEIWGAHSVVTRDLEELVPCLWVLRPKKQGDFVLLFSTYLFSLSLFFFLMCA